MFVLQIFHKLQTFHSRTHFILFGPCPKPLASSFRWKFLSLAWKSLLYGAGTRTLALCMPGNEEKRWELRTYLSLKQLLGDRGHKSEGDNTIRN